MVQLEYPEVTLVSDVMDVTSSIAVYHTAIIYNEDRQDK